MNGLFIILAWAVLIGGAALAFTQVKERYNRVLILALMTFLLFVAYILAK